MLVLDPDFLRSFLAISDTGSYGAAAQRVNKTQSTVSAQMRRLEDMLGVALFEKSGRRNSLTPEGRRLLDYAQSIVRLNEETVNAFRGRAVQGSIKIGMSDDYAQAFLPPILSRFTQNYPHVEVEVFTTDSRGLRLRGDLETFDAVLVSSHSGMEGLETLRTDKLFWIGSEDHKTHIEERLPLALWSEGCSWRAKAITALAKSHRPYRVVHTTSNAPLLLEVVRSGLGVTIGPKWYLKPGLRVLKDLNHASPLDEDGLGLKIINREASEPLSAFIDYVRTYFRGEGSVVG